MPRRPCLLVADDYGQAIFRFDPGTGAFIDEFVPPTSVLAHPPGLDVGLDGNLYVASNVLFFHPDPPKTLGVLRFRGGNGSFAGVVAPHDVNGLHTPGYLKFGPDGNLDRKSTRLNSSHVD